MAEIEGPEAATAKRVAAVLADPSSRMAYFEQRDDGTVVLVLTDSHGDVWRVSCR